MARLDELKPEFVLYNMTTFFPASAWIEANRVPGIPVLQLLLPTADYPTQKFEPQEDNMEEWRKYFRFWLSCKPLDSIKETMVTTNSSVTSDKVLKMLDWENENTFIREFSEPTFPMIFGVSELMTGRPHEATANHHVVGFFIMDAAQQMSQAGEKHFGGKDEAEFFMKGGSPPVYFGWGSMGQGGKELTAKVVMALKELNQRGIVVAGWGKTGRDQLEDAELIEYAKDNVFFAPALPHEWLFPQCSCIVHHGGAGTVAANFRAGRPGLIMPCMPQTDQTDWARRVKHLGVGGHGVHPTKITSEELAGAIRECIDNEAVCRKAKALGDQLRAEHGTGDAIAVIKSYIEGPVATGDWINTRRW